MCFFLYLKNYFVPFAPTWTTPFMSRCAPSLARFSGAFCVRSSLCCLCCLLGAGANNLALASATAACFFCSCTSFYYRSPAFLARNLSRCSSKISSRLACSAFFLSFLSASSLCLLAKASYLSLSCSWPRLYSSSFTKYSGSVSLLSAWSSPRRIACFFTTPFF